MNKRVKLFLKKIRYVHIPSKTLLFLIAISIFMNVATVFYTNIKLNEIDSKESITQNVANTAQNDIFDYSTQFDEHISEQEEINNYFKEKQDLVSFSMFTDFGIIGDSHAVGSISLNGEDLNEYIELSWGEILARRNGNEHYNFAIGGCTTDYWLDDTNERGLKLLKETKPLSLYILCLGINDFNQNGMEYLGSVEDINAEDFRKNANSFYGNYARIISEIKQHSPKAKIIMMTMADNWSEEAREYNEAIIEIAELCDVICIHLHEHEFFKSDLYRDNLKAYHPTAVLYSGMAVAIEEMVEEKMVEEIKYFEDYIG